MGSSAGLAVALGLALLVAIAIPGGHAPLRVPTRGGVPRFVLPTARLAPSIARASDGTIVARDGAVTATFGRGGPRLHVAGGQLTLSAALVGVGARSSRSATPVMVGDHVTYRLGALTGWYRAAPRGIEQGFSLTRPLAHGSSRWIAIAVRLSGTLRPSRRGAGVVFSALPGGAALLRYGGLRASDATGARLPTRLALRGNTILLEVDAAAARYPLTVDPLIAQGAKLAPSAGGGAGQSVALSADGSTALVGSPGTHSQDGAAFVYTRSGSTWTQQAELVADCASACSGSGQGMGESGMGQLGWSVALSASGNTAIVGAPQDAAATGAAFIFTRTGSTWTEVKELTGPGDSSQFGMSVSLSGAGTTALVGAPETNTAYIYTGSGSSWAAQPTLSGSGDFGSSVALSSDASTAIVGSPLDGSATGSASIYAYTAGSWPLQQTLTGSGDASAEFGQSVALSNSSNGDYALIGGSTDNGNAGAAWLFAYSGTSWVQQGSKLIASDSGMDHFGQSVALSSDGSTALIGGNNDNGGDGAAWTFAPGDPTSLQKLLSGAAPGSETMFGQSVALSSTATTALVGAPSDSGGAAWPFTSALMLGGAGNTVSATQNGPGVAVDPGLTVTDSGSATLDSASVTISSGGANADTLAATTTGTAISASYMGGTLSLYGTDTLARYQSVLDSVTFSSTSGTIGSRTITWNADDGTGGSNGGVGDAVPVTSTVAYAMVPGAPTGVSAVAGNASATVSFSPPASNGGATISSYTVTAYPGGASASGAGSPITVSGLTNGTAYTFTVTATSAAGSGPASTPASPVTPFTVPGAATGVSAVAGNASATVSFSPPASNGGATISSYTVTASPGGASAIGSGKPIIVNGLANGTAYTFTVTATNAAGSGAASAPSSAVTPLTVPGAATGVSAVAGNASATVSFAPPASNGGATIGSYTVTAYPGGASATGAGSPIVIGGLANGTAYAFTVTATNTAGSGATSDPSSPVTPNAPRSRAKHVTPTPKPDVVVVINQTIGPVSIDMTETEVEQLIGEPSSTLTLSFGHGRHGRLARYTLHGGLYLVTYDAAGRVVSIQAASSYWHTAGGVGPGSSLSRAAALHGFRVDYCEYGYWNGSAHTAPGAPVTIFVPGSTTVASVLITVLSYNTDCEAPPQLAPVPEPGAVVLNHSIGGVSIGMTEAAVNKLLGHAPMSTVRLTLGGGKSGHYARYRSHGGAFLVTYNSTGHVLSIEAYAPFYRTDGGLGVGPGSSLGAAATLRGFRVDYCEFGYWNGSARTAPNQVVTIFTPNSGEVASVLITEYRFYTACHSGPTSVAPPS